MRPISIALAIVFGLTGCAKDSYVLLPGASGEAGTLQVKPVSGGPAVRLESAYQSASSTLGGSFEQQKSSEEEVRKRYAAALDAVPPAPGRYTLYFVEGSDELTAASKKDLDAVMAEIKARPVPDIVVVGHTDRVGQVADNDRLALRRAESFRRKLVQQGIAEDAIQVAGRGEREPLVNTADEVAEPRNRRVEVLVR